MRRISYATLSRWCAENGYELHDWVPFLPSGVRFPSVVPSEPQLLPEYVDYIVNTVSPATECVLWIRDWTIWNERSQNIGLFAVDLLTQSAAGEHDVECRTFVIARDDWRETIALMIMIILFGWDAHLLFQNGGALIDISHHGELVFSFAKHATEVADKLREWNSSGRRP